MNGSHEFETGSSSAERVTATASGGSGRSVSRFSSRSTSAVDHGGRDLVDAEPGDTVHPRCALHRDDLPVRISRVPEASSSAS